MTDQIKVGDLVPPDMVEKVLKALQNPAWDWRTVAGIAKEAGLAEDKATIILEALRGVVEQGKTKDNLAVYRLRREATSEKERFWSYITKSSSSSSGSS